MSINKGTDLEQVEIVRRLVTELQTQLNIIDDYRGKRDISTAYGEYAQVLGESGRELDEEKVQAITSTDEFNAQIVFLIQAMRRRIVKTLHGLKEIKTRAMASDNGKAQGAFLSKAIPVAATPAAPPQLEEEMEELDLKEE